MAALITCEKCKAQIAKSAGICPQCGTPAKWNLGNCRTCACSLAISRHRYIDYVRTVSVVGGVGGTRTHAFIQHIPCPQCGEKRPLQQFVDTPLAKVLAVIGIIAGALAMLVLAGLPYWTDQVSTAAGFGLLLAAMVGLGFMLFGITTLNTANKYINKLGAVRYMRVLGILAVGGALVVGLITFLGPVREGGAVHHGGRVTSRQGVLRKRHRIMRVANSEPFRDTTVGSADADSPRRQQAVSSSPEKNATSSQPPNAVTLRGMILDGCTIPSGTHVYALPVAPGTVASTSGWSTVVVPHLSTCERLQGKELRLPVRMDEGNGPT